MVRYYRWEEGGKKGGLVTLVETAMEGNKGKFAGHLSRVLRPRLPAAEEPGDTAGSRIRWRRGELRRNNREVRAKN